MLRSFGMKKVLLFGCLYLMMDAMAVEVTSQAPESGLYIGVGLVNTQDKIDWSGRARMNGQPEYVTTYFNSFSRRFNGQAFLGYKNHKPFFLAIECNLNFGKNKFSQTFDMISDGIQSKPSLLDIKVGNDVSIGVKIGKTLYNTVTPYVTLGCCYRQSDFTFSYCVDPVNDSEWARSGSHKSVSKIMPIFGCGCLFHLDNKTDIKLEYCYRPNYSVNYSTTVDTTLVDEPGCPREFQLKDSSHSVSFGISRTLSW